MELYIELAKEAIERDAEEALSSLHATADVHHIGFDWALEEFKKALRKKIREEERRQ